MSTVGHKVSVIMPVYNVEKYIEMSVQSICAQDFDDYQVILVNDGTLDNSVKIVEEIMKHSEVDYTIINQENKGISGARNSGLKIADGKYVVFVDSDDVVVPQFLKSLYDCCEENGLVASFANYEMTRLGNRQGKAIKNYNTVIYDRNRLLYYNMCRSIKICLCATMLQKAFLVKNNLRFNEDLRFGEEVDFIWRSFPLIDKMGHIDAPMYKYLMREKSLMTAQSKERIKKLLEIINEDLKIWFNDNPDDAKRFKYVEQKVYFEKMHAFASQSKFGTFMELLEETDYKSRLRQLYDFPDFKIRILSWVLKNIPFIFWGLFQIV